MKTNKSFEKRIKTTRRRKLLVRKSGKSHFKSKQRRRKQLQGRRLNEFDLDNKGLSRYLPHSLWKTKK